MAHGIDKKVDSCLDVTQHSSESYNPEARNKFTGKNNTEFESTEKRRQTFQNTTSIPAVKIHELVVSGFYYEDGSTICWRCGLKISFWDAKDNAFVEHSSKSPSCLIMKEQRSALYSK